jgi:hypothetical protein
MIVYSDDLEVRVGDAVSLVHGTHSGTILHIIDSAEAIDAWNPEEPGLMIDTSYGGLVFYPQRSLDRNEIGFISRGS